MTLALALVSAMLLGTGFVLQQHAAEQAPKKYFLHLRLIAELLRQPRWLAGIVVMAAGEILSAWAIGHLALSLAEPLLTTNLAFALLLAVPMSRQPLRKSELLGTALLIAGVAALSAARSVRSSPVTFGSLRYWPAAALIAVIAYAFTHAGRRRTGDRRATLTGTGVGLVFGISDALTRGTMQVLDAHGVTAAFTSWPAYAMIASDVLGIWLMESAFNAGPLHASLPAITAGEPVTGIALGIVVFGDTLNISPGMLALQAAGLAGLIGGVILVARAPVLSSLRPATLVRQAGNPEPPPNGHQPARGDAPARAKPPHTDEPARVTGHRRNGAADG
jgi:drug/metabolite transporter (DMT)-like permease